MFGGSFKTSLNKKGSSVPDTSKMIVIALALISAVCSAPTDQESVRISFSQKALDFGEDVAFYMIDIIQKVAVGKLTLPNVSTDSFRATSLKFSGIDLGKPEISTVPGVGMKWRNGNARIVVKGNWAAKVGWWWYDGSMTLDARLAVDAVAGITASNGKLATAPKGCNIGFHSFDLDLGNSFLSWVAGLFEGLITPEIKNAVCNEVNKLLRTTVNGVIASLPHDIPVADILDVEIEADSDPVFASSTIDISARVKADSQGSDTVFPFNPEPIVSQMDPSLMACVLISDYTLNTASYIALSAGQIRESVPNEVLDATNPVMNTAYFKTSIPDFYNAYPDSAIVYSVVNTRYPRAEFDHDNVIVDMPVNLMVEVGGSDVITLAITLTVEGNMQHTNNVLSGQITSATHTTSITSSSVGSVTVDQIDSVVDDILENTVLPQINTIITKGVTLPIDQYVNLNKGVLEAHDDFVKVCADATLTDFTLQELKKIAENIFDA